MSDFERYGCPDCKQADKRIAELEAQLRCVNAETDAWIAAALSDKERAEKAEARVAYLETKADVSVALEQIARAEQTEDNAIKAQDNIEALQDLLHKASCEIDALKLKLDNAEGGE